VIARQSGPDQGAGQMTSGAADSSLGLGGNRGWKIQESSQTFKWSEHDEGWPDGFQLIGSLGLKGLEQRKSLDLLFPKIQALLEHGRSRWNGTATQNVRREDHLVETEKSALLETLRWQGILWTCPWRPADGGVAFLEECPTE
jgi:hypothetical protein